MEFLKGLLGDELFTQIESKINEHNGNEANKDKQIKLGNLGTGEYVSKSKHEALNELLKGKEAELTTANGLIEELKKGTKGNEELQAKIGAYDTQVKELQAQIVEAKLKAAVKVGLLEAKCTDVDYVTYKLMESLKEKGESLELDENENVKGWSEKLSGLQTQLPTQFETQKDGYQVLGDNRLPSGTGSGAEISKEQFDKMGYQSRLKLKQEQPEVYAKMTGKTNN